MSLTLLPGFTRLLPGRALLSAGFCSRLAGVEVRHDREKQRFSVRPEGGHEEEAVLSYRFTSEQEVELMSTFVPESFRGRGLAAVLSQAALDFVLEQKLTARVSCWYIHKYLKENPEKYTEIILP
ncbi:unnamed protein product [Knipowitschia caucasica]|uniref:Protein NATD1 n=1 Tax=Knipowitschia caucasica TaxID=637954 RepID=A0AAV2KCG2_KNICA